MSMNQPPWNQQPNAPPGYQPSGLGTVRARSQPAPKGCRCGGSGSGWHGASFVPARRRLTGILVITACAHRVRAVLHHRAVRRRVQLDYRGEPGARCLIDGRPVATDPPRDATEALRLVSTLVRTPGVAVAAVALLVKLDGAMAFAPALDVVRSAWPDVPHLACLGTQPHVEAMLDDQFLALLGRSDDRAERILDYPPGHFARARERARAKLKE